ncbi:alpha/beta-hydrolase [Peniophora sp. CONT]|nr:alpha/beta-hydrolase [Peniophora sp. CONT]
MPSTYAVPEPREWRSFPLPPLLPADPPPSNLLRAPELPTWRAPSDFGNGYIRSTHVFPASWPRKAPFVPTPPYARATDGEGKEAKKARVKKVSQELIGWGERYENGELDEMAGSDKILWMCANRYARASPTGSGLTMICLHANGMHKELFEPILNRLFMLRDDVDEVWALDALQHGDSALLNEIGDGLGVLFSWSDAARDLLCFLQHYLPPHPCVQLPTLIERVPTKLSQLRAAGGFSSRKIIGVGHSFGGCLLTLAARTAPALFDALVLVDPLILPRELDPAAIGFLRALLSGAVGRRNSWASREDALKAFKPSPLGAWPDEVLRLYVQHGLTENLNGGVRLKCAGLQEAVVFVEGRGAHQAWTVLPDIDERVAIHWILPPTGQSIAMVEDLAAARVHRRTANSSHVVLAEGTHLLVQSNPAEVAVELNNFMVDWTQLTLDSKSKVQAKARL